MLPYFDVQLELIFFHLLHFRTSLGLWRVIQDHDRSLKVMVVMWWMSIWLDLGLHITLYHSYNPKTFKKTIIRTMRTLHEFYIASEIFQEKKMRKTLKTKIKYTKTVVTKMHQVSITNVQKFKSSNVWYAPLECT